MFPDGRFDNLDLLTDTLPGFWLELYGGRDLVVDFLRGATVQERQLSQLEDEFWDAASRPTCPLYHSELAYVIVIRESDGDAEFSYPLASDVASVPLLTDGTVFPSNILTDRIDYTVTAGRLAFSSNPFLDSRFTVKTDSNGRFLRFYAVGAGLDWQYLSKLYGSILGVTGSSSGPYQKLTDALLDAVAVGATDDTVQQVVEAITDTPMAVGGETVVAVVTESDRQLVITDHNVYRLSLEATASVAVGDDLSAGQSLCDAAIILRSRSEILANLTTLTLGNRFLWPGSVGTLGFGNADVAIVSESDGGSHTKVSFALTGDDSALALFFDAIHDRGLAANGTLAEYLDIRETPTDTAPTAASLPATINPLDFLVSNVLRGSVYVIKNNEAAYGDSALSLTISSTLRKVLPPHVTVIVTSEDVDSNDTSAETDAFDDSIFDDSVFETT